MKFRLSFNIHKDLMTSGTKEILEIPGLVSFKGEDNTLAVKLLCENNSIWNYVPSSSIINGWNSVEFSGNDEIMILKVNSHIYPIIFRSWYSGFSNNNYLTIPEFYTANMNSFKMQTVINLVSSTGISNQGIFDTVNDTAIRLNITTDGYLHFRVSSSGSQSYIIDLTGTSVLPSNKDILVEVLYDSINGYTLQHTVDGNTIIDGTSSDTTRPYIKSSNKIFITGTNAATSYNYYLNGSLCFSDTRFTLDDEVVFDGNTAVFGEDYNIVGSLSSQGGYPNISTGKMEVYQSWLYLKDVDAEEILD